MNIFSNRYLLGALSGLAFLACSSSDASISASDASTQNDVGNVDSSSPDAAVDDASSDSSSEAAPDAGAAGDGGFDVYVPADGKKLIATMKTSKGDIVIELNSKESPITSTNFKMYADAKFFDGLIFHRVIQGFMIQGGGFMPGMKARKALYPAIIDEALSSGLSNTAGTIAMARTSNPVSATSQFFINTVDNVFLDPGTDNPDGYAVFGTVTQGMDVVSAIEGVETAKVGSNEDVPVEDVLINSVVVEEK